ncbi:MAG: hypothetical protein DRH06_08015 [Deltaproteobacteria bacterium]|nr:MAG: hypothetical protein DRH06_08015 [Deltaproteobacteria bacterium]
MKQSLKVKTVFSQSTRRRREGQNQDLAFWFVTKKNFCLCGLGFLRVLCASSERSERARDKGLKPKIKGCLSQSTLRSQRKSKKRVRLEGFNQKKEILFVMVKKVSSASSAPLVNEVNGREIKV